MIKEGLPFSRDKISNNFSKTTEIWIHPIYSGLEFDRSAN